MTTSLAAPKSSPAQAPVYGQQLWNYYVRSYPDNVRAHYPDLLF